MTKTLNERAAITVVNALLMEKRPPYPAIETILTHAKYRPRLVEFVIRRTLCRYDESLAKRRSPHDNEALVFCLHLAWNHPFEQTLAEKVVLAAAKAGFHWRFPELPRRLLDRHPSKEEVVLLITSYVENKASSCSSDEEKFEAWAKAYLDRKDADEQIARIRKFQEELKNAIDL